MTRETKSWKEITIQHVTSGERHSFPSSSASGPQHKENPFPPRLFVSLAYEMFSFRP